MLCQGHALLRQRVDLFVSGRPRRVCWLFASKEFACLSAQRATRCVAVIRAFESDAVYLRESWRGVAHTVGKDVCEIQVITF